jgi:uncharacterized protein RhaS with RHS repeats
MNVAADLDQRASYAYDKNGNVTEVGTTTFYTYDFDNRLTPGRCRSGNIRCWWSPWLHPSLWW